jgi:hypothetical protein
MPMPICTRCNSVVVRRSRYRGLDRAIVTLLPIAPFRCLDCSSRFWVYRRSASSIVRIAAVSALAIGMLLLVATFLHR